MLLAAFAAGKRTIRHSGVRMLDYIRSNAQSFGVKVAFGVIILVFVFWGVGSFNDRNEGFKNKEAKKLYNKIFYFTDEKTLQRSDNGLIAELRESNPDWFE